MYENLAILALFAFAYSVVAGRLGSTPFNGALVYVAFGVVAGPAALGLLNLSISAEGIRLVAELTLGLVLFIDASNSDISVLRSAIKLPRRLLLVGLPLTILLGVGVGAWLFPGMGLLEVAILSTMLAPTDAALGKAVVTNENVPAPMREGLNVESGFNDGICVPILFTFLALAAPSSGDESTGALALGLVAEEIGIGGAVGLGLSFLAARALKMSTQRGWIEHAWVGIPLVALALGIFTLAQFAGGSGFIACFAGGLAFGVFAKEYKESLVVGAESGSEAFTLVTWVVFGAAVVLDHPGAITWQVVVYAVLSLTVVRMLPVYLSLAGLGLQADAKLFIGWFGPRGLASVVFGVIVLQEHLPGSDTIIATTVATVVLSVIAHGLTANPFATAFAARRQKSQPSSG